MNYVYYLYNSSNEIIYIGKTERDLKERLDEHTSTKEWWTNVTNIKYQKFSNKNVMADAEAILIDQYKPLYNLKQEKLPGFLIAKRVSKEISNTPFNEYCLTNKKSFIPNVKLLKISKLIINHEWQRELDEKRSLELAENWSDDYCQIPDVILNSKGEYYVADGQHRVVAMKHLGYQEIMCRIIETDENPSSFFVGLNNNASVSSDVMFLQKAKLNNTIEKSILDILTKYEIHTSKPKLKDDKLYLKQIEDITDLSPMNLDVLDNTLELLSRSFCYTGPLTKSAIKDTYTFLLKNIGAYNTISDNMKTQQIDILVQFGASNLKETIIKNYPMKDISKHLIALL